MALYTLSMNSMVMHRMITLWVFEILSSSCISETAIPRRRFMNTRAIIIINMKKNVLATSPASLFLIKEFVKSSSPINIAQILIKESSSFMKDGVVGNRIWNTRQKEKRMTLKDARNFKAENATLLIIMIWIPTDGISASTWRLQTAVQNTITAVMILLSLSSILQNRSTPSMTGLAKW